MMISVFGALLKRNSVLAVLFFFNPNIYGQVTLVPAFVTQNDTVEVIYDATMGNAALVGVSQVYAHTGVITNLSTGPTDWRHVQGNWGTADPKVEMTNLGNNLHSIKYHINSFYGVPANEVVSHLAFVFRDASGNNVGRTATGGDIFVPISQGGFQTLINSPASDFGIYDISDSLDFSAITSSKADLALFHETTLLAQYTDTNEIQFKLPLTNYGSGRYNVILRAVYQGNFYYDTISYLARSGTNFGFDTAQYDEGITILNDTSIALKLHAPFKDFVYVIGDFNNWKVTPEYEMYKSPGGLDFWIVINGLDPNIEYGFQYYIDQEAIVVADPYSEKILDPWNDPSIPNNVYPNLKPYPVNKTNYPVTVIQTGGQDYSWTHTSYNRIPKDEWLIYELLIRDFDSRHTYKSVIDRLDYLDSLGVNAIELMPVMDFEGNESWGYNPMFFMAPDKYYGTEDDLKALIDSCHGRGMMVIMDIVLNHAFGQCPLVRMYFDPSAGPYGQPTAQSPWFNQVAKHDFNVGYDFNHNSNATKYFAKKVLQHWVKEYHIDGYRMDLSKGFTQKNTLGNVAAWGQYDQGRIDILQRLKNDVEEIDSNVVMILEHFADNNEEIELSNRGFMLWGNENHQYNEATMGYPSNLSNVIHTTRGWPDAHLIGYMESHDEERLMYKNIQFGNSSGNYNIKDIETGLDRVELASAFFYPIPGPKMLWQFGEMGYDYSINHCPDGTIDPACRIANKPIRWDYLGQQGRRDLNLQTGNIIKLRMESPNVFRDGNFSHSLQGVVKSMVFNTTDSSAVIIGNFDVVSRNATLAFPHVGWWYDYLSGDSIFINGNYDTVYAPGEFHIFLNYNYHRPYDNVELNELPLLTNDFGLFPNPSSGQMQLSVNLEKGTKLVLSVISTQGSAIYYDDLGFVKSGLSEFDLSDIITRLPEGIYIVQLSNGNDTFSRKFIKR